MRTLTPRGQSPTAWIPEYICREASTSLAAAGVEVRFYPVNLDLQPDWQWFRENSTRLERGQVLVVVHYFGFNQEAGRAEEFCRERGLTLLEDAAHGLPMGSLGEKMRGAAMVFSPRKLLPLPEGGILVLKKDGAGGRLDERRAARGSLRDDLFWLARRFGRRWLLMLGLRPQFSQQSSAPDTEDGHIEAPLPEDCNNLWLRLFRYYWRQRDLIKIKRRTNYLTWLEVTKSPDFLAPVFPQIPADCCPQVFPVFVRGNRDLLLGQLRKAGIPAGTWPDLPDEILSRKSSSAHRIKDQLLTLPVHQDLREKDIIYMGASLRQCKTS